MKAIITGGAGFIGSHLAELCLSKGLEVIVIDNLSNGSLKNLEFAKGNSNLEFIKDDILNIQKYKSKFKDVDYFFHLAGMADIVPSIDCPVKYHRVNVEGTLEVLEFVKQMSVKKFLYAASSSCYGIPKEYPTSETENCNPMYPYALTKMIGEQYAMHWGKTYNIPIISLRLFNVYGTRAQTKGAYGAVFKVFLAQKLANKPFTVVGDGTQSRDFTYVTDVAQAFLDSAESEITNEIMNVGTGRPQSVNRLVQLLGGKVEYIPKRPGEPEITQANIEKITSKLNWSSKVNFEAGVQLMLDNIEYWEDAKIWSSSEIEHATKSWFKFLGN